MRLFPSARNRAAFLLLLAALLGCQPSGDAARATPDAASSAAEAAASPSAASPAADAAADIPDTPDAAAGAAPLSPRRAQWLADDVSRHLVIVHHVDPHAAPARVVADAFVLVPGDEGAPMDAAEKLVGDTAAALFRGPFAHRPDRATTVWVFAALAPYRAALRARIPDVPPSDYGVYDAASRQIFVCAATATILTAAHEVTHVLGSADFPHAPKWLAEGVASLFEVPDFDSAPGEIHGKPHPVRTPLLRDAIASKDRGPLVRLDALFGMSDEAWDQKDLDLHYAMAREAMRWLDRRGLLWRFYHAWRDGILDDATGEKAFARVVGATPAQATAQWLEWVRSPDALR